MSLYRKLIRPALFSVDPERIHHLAMAGLRGLAALPWRPQPDSRLAREVFGIKFPNPIGLAAGFDKNALVLPAWEKLGFGFVEAGTITAHGQPGNPKPRLFRVCEKEAIINRMGFNNDGAEAIAARLSQLKSSGRWPSVPIGLNIGKSKITPIEEASADYIFSFEKLFPYADYFVLNVSSPNTPGLRALQGKEALDELLGAVQKRNRELSAGASLRPVLLKIAPDLEFPKSKKSSRSWSSMGWPAWWRPIPRSRSHLGAREAAPAGRPQRQAGAGALDGNHPFHLLAHYVSGDRCRRHF